MKFGKKSNQVTRKKSPIRTLLLAVLMFKLGFSVHGVSPLNYSTQTTKTKEDPLDIYN